MARLRIGCVGWSYSEWAGSFYPTRAEAADYLTLYARAFEIVEVDTSFYAIPSQDMTRAWSDATPESFLFTAKFPRLITHERQFVNVDDPLRWFFNAISLVRPKLGPLVIQLPPRFSIGTGRKLLEDFVDALPSGYRYAIEFRHPSWFTPETYSWLEDRGVALCWSENDYVRVPAIVTTDFVLDETFTRLFRRRPFAEAWRYTQGILDAAAEGYLLIERITEARFLKSVELRRKLDDKPHVSFTDLTSVVVMSERKISDVLTADVHFRQVGLGFRTLPD